MYGMSVVTRQFAKQCVRYLWLPLPGPASAQQMHPLLSSERHPAVAAAGLMLLSHVPQLGRRTAPEVKAGMHSTAVMPGCSEMGSPLRMTSGWLQELSDRALAIVMSHGHGCPYEPTMTSRCQQHACRYIPGVRGQSGHQQRQQRQHTSHTCIRTSVFQCSSATWGSRYWELTQHINAYTCAAYLKPYLLCSTWVTSPWL
jgi:hypothetical protein